MKSTIKSLWVFLVTTLIMLTSTKAQNTTMLAGGIQVNEANLEVQGNVYADHFLSVQTPPCKDSCNVNALLNDNFVQFFYPETVLRRYCLLRCVDSDPDCVNARGNLQAGMEIGSAGARMVIRWSNIARANARIDKFGGPYRASSEGFAKKVVELEIPPSAQAPAGSPVKVFYAFRDFNHNYCYKSSNDTAYYKDLVKVTLNNIDIKANVGLFSPPPFNVSQGKHPSMISFFIAYAGVPFYLEVESHTYAAVNAPGEEVLCPDLFTSAYYDNCFSNVFGELVLSLGFIPPLSTEIAGDSYFSIDIGSDSELSDQFASGNEVFDPGDAYRIKSAALPFGGANGDLDDANHTGDFPPTPPDPSVPSTTAAPVGLGIPIELIQNDYLNIDGVARLDFELPEAVEGDVYLEPMSAPLDISTCLMAPEHIYLSFDDDAIGNYATQGFYTPSSSTYAGTPFGQGPNRDEVIEVFAQPGVIYSSQPLARESDIHVSMFPNPGNTDNLLVHNDDVNAISFASNIQNCNVWYISVDHEARGQQPNGGLLDPGVIYKVGQAGENLVPVVTPEMLGLNPGVDINAFEFVRVSDINFDEPVLALLFSVDVDDPFTIGIDEGSNFTTDESVLYLSYLTGSHFPLDSSFVFQGNIDAIGVFKSTIGYPATVNTCVPSNFLQAPQGLTAVVSPQGIIFQWLDYPFATSCRLSGNRVSNPNDLVLDVPTPPSTDLFRSRVIQTPAPGTYRVRVRCGCSTFTNSAFSSYIEFIVPAPLPEADFNELALFGELQEDRTLSVYPNPATNYITIQALLPEISRNEGNYRIDIYNMLGQKVKELEVNHQQVVGGHRVHIHELSSGQYIVRLIYGDMQTQVLMSVKH